MTNSIPTGYKPSPLGLIPQDWEVVTIGSKILFSGGSQPPLNTFSNKKKDGYIRLIQTRDYRSDKYKVYIKKDLARKRCTENDVMIGRYGPPIFQIFRGIAGAYNVALIKASSKEGIFHEYMYYFITRVELRKYLEGLSQRSGGQTGIDMEMLKKYPLPLPPLPEQKAIASILSSCDETITQTQQLIYKLECRHKALCQQLLTGKKRVAGFSGEWKEVRMGDVFKRVLRKNTKGCENVLTISAQKGLINQEHFFNKKIASETLDNYFLLKKNEFAYNKSYSNGYPMGAIKRLSNYEEGVVTTLYICFKLIDGDIDFFEHYFHNQLLVRGLKKVANEGGRAHGLLNVTPTDFFNLVIKIPSKVEQSAITKIINCSEQQINYTKQKLEKLQQLKKGLMQQLLTGKKRVNLSLF